MGLSATLVITGMHRSGTSLIASAFQLAGVNVGDHLDGPSQGNLRGHFEDVDFQKFHDRVLGRAGKNFLTATQADADVVEMTPDDVEHAKALIDRRRARPLWGWKDPRTSLFLDFWHPLLGSPRYVFVYRHPLEVVLSLFRRGWYLEEVENPLVALEAWRQHNQAILDFCRRHRDQCLLGHVRPMAGDLVGTVSLCARRLGLDLVSESASAIYQPSELTQRVMSGDVLAEFARIAPSAAVLYHRLEQAADLPDAKDIRPAGPTPLVGASLDARRDADTLRRDFELLLAQLEPRTFVGGKESLDALRKRELESLGAQCRHLAAELAAHQAHVANLGVQNGALQARMAELAAQNTGLQSEVIAGERSRAGLESRLVETESRLAEAQSRQVEGESRLAEAQSRQVETESRLAEAQSRLAEAESRQAEVQGRLAEAQSGLAEAQSLSVQTTMRAELEAENAARRAGEARLDADVAELRRSLEQTQRSLGALKEQAATDLAARARTIQRQADAESSALAKAITQAEARSAAAEARSAAAEGRSIATEAHLAAIGRTRAWRAAQKWYAIKRAAARMLPF